MCWLQLTTDQTWNPFILCPPKAYLKGGKSGHCAMKQIQCYHFQQLPDRIAYFYPLSNGHSLHNWGHLLFICFFIDWEKQLSGVLDRFEFGFNLWKVEQEQIIWIRGRGRARHFFSNDFVKGTNNNFEYDLPCLNNYSIMRFVHFLFNMKHLLQYFDIINFYTYSFRRDNFFGNATMILLAIKYQNLGNLLIALLIFANCTSFVFFLSSKWSLSEN